MSTTLAAVKFTHAELTKAINAINATPNTPAGIRVAGPLVAAMHGGKPFPVTVHLNECERAHLAELGVLPGSPFDGITEDNLEDALLTAAKPPARVDIPAAQQAIADRLRSMATDAAQGDTAAHLALSEFIPDGYLNANTAAAVRIVTGYAPDHSYHARALLLSWARNEARMTEPTANVVEHVRRLAIESLVWWAVSQNSLAAHAALYLHNGHYPDPLAALYPLTDAPQSHLLRAVEVIIGRGPRASRSGAARSAWCRIVLRRWAAQHVADQP